MTKVDKFTWVEIPPKLSLLICVIYHILIFRIKELAFRMVVEIKQIFSESRLKSCIDYTEPIGNMILKLEADLIEQLHTQILDF